MKKASSARGFVACILLIMFFVSPSHAQNPTCENKRVAGDYNCDNVINVLDFESFQQDFVAHKTTLVYFESWRRAMFGVVTTQTRWSNYSGNQTERTYVAREFEKMGYTTTSQSFSVGSVNSANVIARLNGKDTT